MVHGPPRARPSRSRLSATQFDFRFHGLCGHANEENLSFSSPRVYRAVHVTLRREERMTMRRVGAAMLRGSKLCVELRDDADEAGFTLSS